MTDFEPTFVEEMIARHGRRPEALIPILHELQGKYGYLPAGALDHLCTKSDIRPADVTGVATFYDRFRHAPVGKHIVKVCKGTACHVAGADKIDDAIRRHLHIAPGEDTDPTREYTVESVACVGCCTLAPVADINGSILGHVTAENAADRIRDHFANHADQTAQPSTEELVASAAGAGKRGVTIHVGLGSCCMAKGSDGLYHALREHAEKSAVPVHVKRVGCMGMCHRTPMIEVAPEAGNGDANRFYAGLTPDHASSLIRAHFRPRGLLPRAREAWRSALDGLIIDVEPPATRVAEVEMKPREPEVRAFLGRQVHIATEHFGRVDPLDLDEYVATGGFDALRHVLADLKPDDTISIIERSGLRGRGGAGFPTGQKWRVMSAQPGPEKYVICNGDEGDPGAFMDRMILESFPFRVIEGLAIAALATGAETGYFYIRHEYPLAVKRIRAALATLERRGWIGEKLLGAQRPFRVSVVEGAGAFVCGEETALIQSIEGKRGMPRLRPPFPAQSGLWGKPTLINNVETLSMVPWIVRHGAEKFAAIGTAKSKGTKVFALAGHIVRGGLIEVPMGTTIREIVEDIGGGVTPGRKFKAVQIGGPSGGCVPARLADTPVDFESLREVGAIMGSGGLVVLDDSTCMVDVARYFLQFTEAQSCGKCTFCRIGTKRMLDLLELLCAGKAQRSHLEELKRLAHQVGAGSLCGLGKTAPNPVLSTLRYFHDEYEAHLRGHCPAGKCTGLIKYSINADCTGCTICAQQCPVDAIPLTPYARHTINLDLCTRCDTCRKVCPHHAVEVS
ncbi:MAG: NAD(P)H-dependent oxidoreductase subunit E [Verrucomicrobia bacterium]|nr:NAD(P)H-dependent oxidoreductase subunit E [Verrucomicrobiota bacterium]